MQALFLWLRLRFGARLVPVRDLLADNQLTHRKVGYASKLSIRRAPLIAWYSHLARKQSSNALDEPQFGPLRAPLK